MGKTLYVSDLDGTLLTGKDRVSKYSKKIINQLVNQGMTFTYATARSLTSARVVTEGLFLRHPVVTYNGAALVDPVTGRSFLSIGFTREEAERITEVIRKEQIYPMVYSNVDGIEKVSWLQGTENEGMRRYFSLRKGDKRMNPVKKESEVYKGEPFYFTCIGEKEELLPLYETLKEEERFRCTLQQELYRTEYWCEIMPRNATKANGILQLKESLGCDRIVCFGDAINDIPMFQIAEESYAVANAVAGLKAVATGQIASNEEDGVAKWLLAHYSDFRDS